VEKNGKFYFPITMDEVTTGKEYEFYYYVTEIKEDGTEETLYTDIFKMTFEHQDTESPSKPSPILESKDEDQITDEQDETTEETPQSSCKLESVESRTFSDVNNHWAS